VVTVHKELDKSVEKYFVSGGFAFVHPDSTADICAVEAVKVSDLDPDAVRAGLQVRPGASQRVWTAESRAGSVLTAARYQEYPRRVWFAG
jgi:F0F1-type ATP synthase epsilon subunit